MFCAADAENTSILGTSASKMYPFFEHYFKFSLVAEISWTTLNEPDLAYLQHSKNN